MNLLRNTVNILQDTQYMTVKNFWSVHGSHISFEPLLLKNGLSVRDHLFNIWCNTKVSWANRCVNFDINKLGESEEQSRLSFIENDQFNKNYEKFCKVTQTDSKSIEFKSILNYISYNEEKDTIFQTNNRSVLLVSEYFIDNKSDALEKFYNIQRERKIWWMLYSANPSRLFVEPYIFSKESTDTFCKNCNSITIKSRFPFGLANMESITLAPLDNLGFLNYPNIYVIRSVVNLDLATSALILDGKEHNRCKFLLLNRKLTPYQMLLSNLNRKDETTNKLILHLECAIRKCGLRLYDKPVILRNCYRGLDVDVSYFDSLGVPYMLFVDKESIKTGLMKLRSRDTTIYETIHISDIPNYLLNIFSN